MTDWADKINKKLDKVQNTPKPSHRLDSCISIAEYIKELEERIKQLELELEKAKNE